MKIGFQLNAGTKFKPILRNDFSESESSKFFGMVTAVLRFSGHESFVIFRQKEQKHQLQGFFPSINSMKKSRGLHFTAYFAT